MLFSKSKQSSSKLPSQLMPITGVISRVVTPEEKKKSIPIARQKVRTSKFVVSSSLSQCHYEEGVFTPKGLPASKHGSKMNRDNKSASRNNKLNIEV